MITALTHRPNKKRTRRKLDRVIFIGFMGAGKSHCAKELAKELGWFYRDSDAIIEKREGRSIQQIFKDRGESYFRTIESKVIKDLLKKPQLVLAFGGGAVCRKVNRALIRKGGHVVWVKSNAEVISKRTKASRVRPLLNVKDPKKAVRQLMKEREPYYRQCSHDSIINNGGAVMPKLRKIVKIRQLMQKQTNGHSL